MLRDRATKTLERVLSTIESGAVPVAIHEVWVFGSYARGAPAPGDVDVILIHEPMSESLRATLEVEARSKRLDRVRELFYPEHRFQRMITSPLRKPADKLDLLLGSSLSQVLSRHSVVQGGRMVLLWSPHQPDWRAALASITPDENATRAFRREFLPCKRAKCSLEDMTQLTAWIDRGAMVAKVIGAPEWPIALSGEAEARIAKVSDPYCFGKASRACLPLAAWWLERAGCDRFEATRGELYSRPPRARAVRPTLRVTFGALYPAKIVWFLDQPGTEATAHILHFKRGEPRQVLEFRRGPAWVDRCQIGNEAVGQGARAAQ